VVITHFTVLYQNLTRATEENRDTHVRFRKYIFLIWRSSGHYITSFCSIHSHSYKTTSSLGNFMWNCRTCIGWARL